MGRKKTFKITAIILISGITIGSGIGLYLFNMPHRDVQSTKTDFSLSCSQIVEEYLNNKDAANLKYLSEDGNSKILEIHGPVSDISEDYDGNKVLLLKAQGDNAGVRATFTPETNKNINGITIGQEITVKGVIRSGASYNDDLELFENVILEKSDIIIK